MRPIVRKLLALQLGFLLALGGFFWWHSRETPEDALERRAEELAGYLKKQQYEKAIEEMTLDSERKQIGIGLVEVREVLRARFQSSDPIPPEEAEKILERLRGGNLVADLLKMATTRDLEENEPESGRMLRILVQLEEPVVGTKDLDDPAGEALAAELARKFFVRWLGETALPLDRDALVFSSLRDVGPEGSRSSYLTAIVRYGDGRDTVDYRFHQRKPTHNQDPVWYLDVASWIRVGE